MALDVDLSVRLTWTFKIQVVASMASCGMDFSSSSLLPCSTFEGVSNTNWKNVRCSINTLNRKVMFSRCKLAEESIKKFSKAFMSSADNDMSSSLIRSPFLIDVNSLSLQPYSSTLQPTGHMIQTLVNDDKKPSETSCSPRIDNLR